MSLATASAVSLSGLSGHVVEVQAQLAYTVPGFTLVGLPDAALNESRDRVRAAVLSSQLQWPNRKITVNLSPASLPKSGSAFDVAIAVAILAGQGVIPQADLSQVIHIGELGLDGRLQPVRGVLPMVAAAVQAGITEVVVAWADVQEASLVPGATVHGAVTLADVVAIHGGQPPFVPQVEPVARPTTGLGRRAPGDLADVLGQQLPRLALEVAAAGGHHLLLSGPPGAGKTMLASRLPGILPPLTQEQAVEVTAVHSIAGVFDAGSGLITEAPFEDPHHTATPSSIVGGGSGVPRPGAASRAHRGVLFLDEAPEFSAKVLDTLRQPLEHGELVIHRSAGTARFPARFQLVLAANPCPCGMGSGKGLKCTCTPMARRRYMARLSGPLLDRVDVQVEVDAVSRVEMLGAVGESSAVVASRVAAARQACAGRLADTPWSVNAEVSGTWLRDFMRPARQVLSEIDRALDAGMLSLRGADRVLRLACTVADLHGRPAPNSQDVGLAMMLRTGRMA